MTTTATRTRTAAAAIRTDAIKVGRKWVALADADADALKRSWESTTDTALINAIEAEMARREGMEPAKAARASKPKVERTPAAPAVKYDPAERYGKLWTNAAKAKAKVDESDLAGRARTDAYGKVLFDAVTSGIPMTPLGNLMGTTPAAVFGRISAYCKRHELAMPGQRAPKRKATTTGEVAVADAKAKADAASKGARPARRANAAKSTTTRRRTAAAK